jgi:NAD(P)H-hydrate epimerase
VALDLILSKPAGDYTGPARAQLDTLHRSGFQPSPPEQAARIIQGAGLVIDALIGYRLRGAPSGRLAALIELCNLHARRVLSLDMPSGVDATSGCAPGAAVKPERTLCLALPKTGLAKVEGERYLADIGLPPEVYVPLGIEPKPIFRDRYWVRLNPIDT